MTDQDHEYVDRIENILQGSESFDRRQKYTDWWQVYYTKAHDQKVNPRAHYKYFQTLLGQQTTTVVFSYRNWVWHRPEEGWTLYVDRRGPAFHVRRGMTPDQAWEAFEKFTQAVKGNA